MMCLVNNWDLAADNNAIYEVDGSGIIWSADVGASFGSTGSSISRSKGKLDDYAKSKFIEKTNADTVDFVMHSKPFFLTAVDVPNYRHRSRMEEVGNIFHELTLNCWATACAAFRKPNPRLLSGGRLSAGQN